MKLDMQGATLFILRGPGARHKSKNRKGVITITSGGKTVIVRKSGLAVFVASKDSPPTRPFVLSAEDLEFFNTQLRTQPSSGASYKPFEIDTNIGNLNLDDIRLRKTSRRNDGEIPDPKEPGFLQPDTGFDRPPEIDLIMGPGAIPIQPCTPLNPHFPNCP